ncbi:MAG: DUF1361 domain-containing protein [Ferruginibacter sp.]
MKLSTFQQSLIAFIGFIIGMLVCRFLYAGNLDFIFLLWNLFLAWIPYKLSLGFSTNNESQQWRQWVLLGCWLLFFPNALYITTDLIHLNLKLSVPLWYDLILIFTAAITGLMMAFASLFHVETFLKTQFTKNVTNIIVFTCLFLGSFGVFLGRFLRVNSWDVLTNPISLYKAIAIQFLYPVIHFRTWAITILLTCFFSLLYFAIKKSTNSIIHPGS